MELNANELKALQKLIPECKQLAKEFELLLTEFILMRILLDQQDIALHVSALQDKT